MLCETIFINDSFLNLNEFLNINRATSKGGQLSKDLIRRIHFELRRKIHLNMFIKFKRLDLDYLISSKDDETNLINNSVEFKKKYL